MRLDDWLRAHWGPCGGNAMKPGGALAPYNLMEIAFKVHIGATAQSPQPF